MILRRHPNGPIITRRDLPPMPGLIEPSAVFNPGAILLDGVPYLLLRVQSRGRRTFLVPARGRTDRSFVCATVPTVLAGLDHLREPKSKRDLVVHHVYDPRLSLCEGRLLVVTALDTDRGSRLVIWSAAGDPAAGFAGLERLEPLAVTGSADTRNGVLFPSRIGGRWLMLERPNQPQGDGAPASGDEITLSSSADLQSWQPEGAVFRGRPRYWDELVGAGPPPLLTRAGWLLVYHGVATHFRSVNIYQAGAAVLDRDDPRRVLARTAENILEPRAIYELTGQVPNVVFPSGMTVDRRDNDGCAPPDARVCLYYGAADTAVGLATTTVGALLDACRG
jgi:beta-1,4-mannooligosaccharide/beta-1,4-mannosyl-N-acetylglucosamine phosphorylase